MRLLTRVMFVPPTKSNGKSALLLTSELRKVTLLLSAWNAVADAAAAVDLPAVNRDVGDFVGDERAGGDRADQRQVAGPDSVCVPRAALEFVDDHALICRRAERDTGAVIDARLGPRVTSP